ncbi:MAG: 30S ribosomal protein S5 [Anaerolineae bacterium]|nr:30S ribosomal protein S5 [Anaerolineae bacterium]
MQRRRERFEEREELDERIVDIARVAKVIKGGRRFGFRVIVVVGDNQGQVGVGVGKARSVPDAIRKGAARARRMMRSVELMGSTIPHDIVAEHGGAKVLLRPASRGTGVIAGGGVRAVVEAAGVRDILSKSLGSSNVLNVVMATVKGLYGLEGPAAVAAMRGLPVSEVSPPWSQSNE